MSILLSKETRVLVQGITGKEGQRATAAMRQSGTVVTCGVTPGKGGQNVDGIPVYGSVAEALQTHPEVNTSVLYVPPAFALAAAREAIVARIPFIVIITERIPIRDTAIILSEAAAAGVRVLGPSSIGVIVPGVCRIGMIGGERPEEIYKPGPIAVLSRSGGMTNEVSWQLCRAGIGISVALSVGGDYLSGTTFADLFPLLQNDEQTRGVVLFDEMGGSMHHQVVAAVENGFSKPIAVYVGGDFASQLPDGLPIGHAGSFIEGGKGTTEEKRALYRAAGVLVAERYDALPQIIQSAIRA